MKIAGKNNNFKVELLHFVFYKSNSSEMLMKSEETHEVRSSSWRVCAVEELQRSVFKFATGD